MARTRLRLTVVRLPFGVTHSTLWMEGRQAKDTQPANLKIPKASFRPLAPNNKIPHVHGPPLLTGKAIYGKRGSCLYCIPTLVGELIITILLLLLSISTPSSLISIIMAGMAVLTSLTYFEFCLERKEHFVFDDALSNLDFFSITLLFDHVRVTSIPRESRPWLCYQK